MQEVEALKEDLLKRQILANQHLEDLHQKYENQLDALLKSSLGAGDLSKSLMVKNEKENFRTGASKPVSKEEFPQLNQLQKIYQDVLAERQAVIHKQLLRDSEGLVTKLNAMVVTLTKAGDLATAQQVLEESKRIDALREKWAAQSTGETEETNPVLSRELEALSKGLILHYSFDAQDAGAEVKDDSGNERKGLNQGAKWVPDGKVGGAFMFDGENDRITLAQPAPDMETMTIAVWIYYTAPLDKGGIYSDWDGANGNDVNLALRDPQTIRVRADKRPGTLNTEVHISSNLQGNWHHLAWTMRQQQSSIYIDGERVESIREEGSNVGHHKDCHIGHSFGTYFQGMMDDFRMWDRELAASEIQTLYEATK